MSLDSKFKNDFIEKYSTKDFNEIESLIEKMFDCDSGDFDQSFTEWNLFLEKEKHSQLQYTYYINLQKGEKGDEINIDYSTGINGDYMDYHMDGSGGMPSCRTIRVLKEVKLIDWKEFRAPKDFTVGDFKKLPDVLLDIYNKRSYDSYITGYASNEYMGDYTRDLQARGSSWELIYEDVDIEL